MGEDSWLSSLIIVFLLFFAAYFATAEMAFASVSRMHIKSRFEKGEPRARRAMYVLNNFERAITSILIGTNIVHISAAAIVTVMVTRRWGVSAVSISTIITTVVVFFVGEMLPKSIGKKHSEHFALSLAGSLCFFMYIFYPLAVILTSIGHAVAKLTRGDGEVTVTEDELYDIIENMKDEGELEQEQGELVHSALLFDNVTAENVLTPRIDVIAVDIDDNISDILDLIKSQHHSRLPVYKDSIDNIVGVLQIRKFIRAWLREGENIKIENLIDEAYFVHQSTNIDDLLNSMSQKKLNLAVVTDNYGGTCGIITIEDILEELVGEIWDEDDEVVESFTELGSGMFELSPELEIEEVFELLDFIDPEDTQWEHESLGQWAYENFDALPREGDSFIYHNMIVTAQKVKNHRILKLLIRFDNEEEGGAAK